MEVGGNEDTHISQYVYNVYSVVSHGMNMNVLWWTNPVDFVALAIVKG